ncbi:putative RNA-directed DNA polymerase, eukaryota, reverse transcriptase zinc-binding domain protein [Tanacetum coccineum]
MAAQICWLLPTLMNLGAVCKVLGISLADKKSPTSEFSIKRGLRQGDSLSPFLFILVMEGLHCAISIAVSSGLVQGIKISSSDIILSHLFYVDDVIITTDWNSNDLDNIIRVFHVFYLASGLKINIHKSNIYGVGVSNEDVSSIARASGCASGSFPLTCLGLPIGSNMSRISNWQPLIDWFQLRLSSWKANFLSIGGRLTLIKSVLGSLGIYYLSIFKAPELVLKDLERSRASFFWGSSIDNKKMAWIKWPNILSSFDNGGLNIGSLKSFNLALLQKWRWRMFCFPNTLWVKIIKAFHGKEGGFDSHGCSFNGTWSKIIGTSNYLHSNGIIPLNSLRFRVGCGTSIRFWKDIWIEESPLCTRKTVEVVDDTGMLSCSDFRSLVTKDKVVTTMLLSRKSFRRVKIPARAIAELALFLQRLNPFIAVNDPSKVTSGIPLLAFDDGGGIAGGGNDGTVNDGGSDGDLQMVMVMMDGDGLNLFERRNGNLSSRMDDRGSMDRWCLGWVGCRCSLALAVHHSLMDPFQMEPLLRRPPMRTSGSLLRVSSSGPWSVSQGGSTT